MPKFSSFNAFGSRSIEGATHLPVWLGFPKPVPVGGTLAAAYCQKGLLLGAGFPVKLASKTITPFVGWEVVSMSTVSSDDVIVIKPAVLGGVTILPAVGDLIQKVGATFATTGKAAEVTAVTALTGADAGKYSVTVLHAATIDSASAGDVITISAAEAAGSSKSIKVQPNGYLYNDIYFGDLEGDPDTAKTLAASGAVIVNNPEGILIQLAPAAYAVKAQMAAAVPGVYQVIN